MQLTVTMGLDKIIRFTGKVTEEEKILLLQQAWVFVNPSLIEGWGITTIEANACGTPVIASNVPGLRDAVQNRHSGILVPYGKADEFGVEIIRMIKSKKIRQSMEIDAIKWATKFDWDISAKKSLAILKSRP